MNVKPERTTFRFAHVYRAVYAIRHTNGSADRIARSFAIGTFIALLPTFGFGIAVAGMLFILFSTLHRPAVIAAFAVWNPLIQIPLYVLALEIGTVLYGTAPVITYNIEFLNQAITITRRVLVGNLIITTCITIIAYLAVYMAIRKFKHKPLFPVH